MSEQHTSLTELTYSVARWPSNIEPATIMIAQVEPELLNGATDRAFAELDMASKEALKDHATPYQSRLAELDEKYIPSGYYGRVKRACYLQSQAHSCQLSGQPLSERLQTSIFEVESSIPAALSEEYLIEAMPVLERLERTYEDKQKAHEQRSFLIEQTKLAKEIKNEQRRLGRPARFAMAAAGAVLGGGLMTGYLYGVHAFAIKSIEQTAPEESQPIDNGLYTKDYMVGIIATSIAAAGGGTMGGLLGDRPARRCARRAARRTLEQADNSTA